MVGVVCAIRLLCHWPRLIISSIDCDQGRRVNRLNRSERELGDQTNTTQAVVGEHVAEADAIQ
jgi:hypothetical protein